MVQNWRAYSRGTDIVLWPAETVTALTYLNRNHTDRPPFLKLLYCGEALAQALIGLPTPEVL